MVILRVNPAEGTPFEVELGLDSIVVGRSSSADVVVADRYMSRRHARLFREGSSWMVEDLGSRRGTTVNGRRVEAACQVAHGDVLAVAASVVRIGRTESSPPIGSSTVSRHIFRSATELLSASRTPLPGDRTDTPSLERYAERLRILNEVHHALGNSLDRDRLLELILDRVFAHLEPEQAVIVLKDARGELYPAASRSVEDPGGALMTSRHLAEEVVVQGRAALVLDAQTDTRFADARSMQAFGVRSLLAAPLLDEEGTLGMIALSSRIAVRQFTEEDMELLVSLASVAALTIRNVSLAEEAAERRRMEHDLALARRIQIALLPDHLPDVAGWQLYGANRPSRAVSGDYFEVLERSDGAELVVLLADVSGKGIAASLLTGYIEALAAAPIEDGASPDVICERVSERLQRRTLPEQFATAFVATVSIVTGKLSYASAGHNPALLVAQSGDVRWLRSTGIPLGVFPSVEYGLGEAELLPGDTLVVYSDGFTEAADKNDHEYGEERLKVICRRHATDSLAMVASAVDEDLQLFVGDLPWADDRTLVMVRRG